LLRGEVAQNLQLRLDLADERGGDSFGGVSSGGSVMLHAEINQPRSREQHNDQHCRRGQPSGIAL
jgi:hypothetical protein